jgi:hypothetical protein
MPSVNRSRRSSARRAGFHFRNLWLGMSIVLAAATAAGISLVAIGTAKPNGISSTAAAVIRPSGYSEVVSDDPHSGVALRGCPYPPPAGTTTMSCAPIDRLRTGSFVIMRCWEDDSPPSSTYKSPRWFYVNEVNGIHRDWSGYVYSAMIPVSQQIIVPHCTSQIINAFFYPKAEASPL